MNSVFCDAVIRLACAVGASPGVIQTALGEGFENQKSVSEKHLIPFMTRGIP